MRLILPLVAAALVAAVVPASAGAATTAGFTLKHGETNLRTGPTVAGAGARECDPSESVCTYESHEFTIAPGEENGGMVVSATWAGLPGQEGQDTQQDWDLFVYKVVTDTEGNEIEALVASSASGGNTQETAILPAPLERPIPAGKYRIYMDNFKVSPDNQDWEGYVAFEPYNVLNVKPTAALTAPETAKAGDQVTLDASRSTDPDGTIANYAWDLDGNGSFETDGGTTPTRQATFRGGRNHVSVRVTDDKGDLAYASRTIVVDPGSEPDRTVVLPPLRGRITFDVKRRQSLADVAVRGVAATVGCPTACRITGTLRITRATARRLGLGSRARTLSTRRRSLSGDGSTPRIRLKPTRRVLAAMRSRGAAVPATVRLVANAQGFAPRTLTRRVLITP